MRDGNWLNFIFLLKCNNKFHNKLHNKLELGWMSCGSHHDLWEMEDPHDIDLMVLSAEVDQLYGDEGEALSHLDEGEALDHRGYCPRPCVPPSRDHRGHCHRVGQQYWDEGFVCCCTDGDEGEALSHLDEGEALDHRGYCPHCGQQYWDEGFVCCGIFCCCTDYYNSKSETSFRLAEGYAAMDPPQLPPWPHRLAPWPSWSDHEDYDQCGVVGKWTTRHDTAAEEKWAKVVDDYIQAHRLSINDYDDISAAIMEYDHYDFELRLILPAAVVRVKRRSAAEEKWANMVHDYIEAHYDFERLRAVADAEREQHCRGKHCFPGLRHRQRQAEHMLRQAEQQRAARGPHAEIAEMLMVPWAHGPMVPRY